MLKLLIIIRIVFEMMTWYLRLRL